MNTIRRLLLAAACLLPAGHVLAQPYTISPDGTEVTDGKTGLIWRRCSEGQTWNGSTCAGTALTLTHEQALAHAQTQTGWRLPNVKELASIADRSRYSPAIDTVVFPDTASTWYWTSTPYAGSAISAWGVFFGTGHVSDGYRSENAQVRLVQ
jgi:hypothetical protein